MSRESIVLGGISVTLSDAGVGVAVGTGVAVLVGDGVALGAVVGRGVGPGPLKVGVAPGVAVEVAPVGVSLGCASVGVSVGDAAALGCWEPAAKSCGTPKPSKSTEESRKTTAVQAMPTSRPLWGRAGARSLTCHARGV